MKIGKFLFVVLLLLISSPWSSSVNTTEQCREFELGSNPVDKHCAEHIMDLLGPGECTARLTKTVGPLVLCGGNSRCGTGCLGAGEEIAIDPNGADWCTELLFAVSCCNPPREKFCLSPASYEIIACKPVPAPAIPPAEVPELEPQEASTPTRPGTSGTPPETPAPEPEGENPASPSAPGKSEKWCGKGCAAAITLFSALGLYGICEWRDIGPCGDDDRDRNDNCKFGRGVDGHCLHPCNPADPNCDEDPLRTSTSIEANQFSVHVNREREEFRLMWNVPLWYVRVGADWEPER